MKKLIVTRHPALITYLQEIFPELIDAEVLTHPVTVADVQGKHVYGVLPLHLAAEARMVTSITCCLDIPLELRGKGLTLDQVKSMSPKTVSYLVSRV